MRATAFVVVLLTFQLSTSLLANQADLVWITFLEVGNYDHGHSIATDDSEDTPSIGQTILYDFEAHPPVYIKTPSKLPGPSGGLAYFQERQPTKGNQIGQVYTLGTTWYDYQHNGTIGKMVSLTPSRGVHFCWMNCPQAQTNPRYAWYNYYHPSYGITLGSGICLCLDRSGYSTLSHFSTGNSVVAYNVSPVEDFAYTQVAYGQIEGMNIFDATALANPPDRELIWPKVTVCSQDYIHVVSCEPVAIDSCRIFYTRSEDGGSNYTTFVEVDTIMPATQDVAASPVSNKVGIAYAKSAFDVTNLGPYNGQLVSEMNNNVFLIESENGVTWDFSAKRNITNLIEPDTTRWPDSTFANGDTLRAYCDVSLLYDKTDYAHIAFTARGLWFDARLAACPDSYAVVRQTLDASVIWHWSEEHDTLTVVADGWYDVGDPDTDPYRGAGRRRSTVDRPSLGQDPTTGYLYCLYKRCVEGDTSGGVTPSHGWANGEIYCSVSTDGGLNWSEGTNLTNTPSPNATPGSCMNEDYPSLAAEVNDTLHIIYVEDKDAGAAVMTSPQEGTWTENPVKYQKVPADSVPPGPPFMPNFNFHVAADATPPEAIDDLAVALVSGAKRTMGDICLSWTEPYDKVGVNRYVLYRSTAPISLGDSLVSITDTTYTDVGAAGDTLFNYFYSVKAVDEAGNKSSESNKVGEFDINLANGE
ncbi:MAG: hypothetical protein AMJ92_00555 [candidate division Zixibacteria bacterium SM23_81]|nr:MAG: hypothetical protein AMJ92_00555 [candidate division Zixibacteria bacterium SM23_81]